MKISKLITSAFCLALGAGSLYAVSGTWDHTKSGNWTDTANWVGGVIADGAGDQLVGASIGAGGVTRTITLDEPHTIGSLNMTANNKTYQFSGTGTITLDALGGTALVRCVSAGSNIINVPLAGTLGTAGMRTPNQNGTVVMTAANTFSGNVYIHRGRLRIANVDALPHGSRTGNIELETGGNPDQAVLDVLEVDATINGLSSNTNPLPAILPLVTSTSPNAGTTTLSIGDNDANATFDGAINDGTARIIAITKVGNGVQSLRGDNGYTGTTTVNAGVLAMDKTSSSAVIVNGGVLGGSGTIYSTVTVGAGGAVSGGITTGILTSYGFDLSAGGTNIWDLVEDSDSNPGVDFDQLNAQGLVDLTDASLIVRLSGGVDVNDAFWTTTRSWPIISGPGTTGSSNFKAIVVTGAEVPGNFSTANDGSTVTLTFTPGLVKKTPKITSVVRNATSATVNYENTASGEDYVLQYRTNVVSGSWVSVATNTAVGTTGTATDNTAGAGATERFYRVYYIFP